MGEYADEILDNMLSGVYDDWHDEWDGYDFVHIPRTCRRCDKPGLSWATYKGAWRLHEPDGQLHVCNFKTYGVDLSGLLENL